MKTHTRKSFLICLLGFLLVPLSVSAVVVKLSGYALSEAPPTSTIRFGVATPTGFPTGPGSTGLFDSTGAEIIPSTVLAPASSGISWHLGVTSSAPIKPVFAPTGGTPFDPATHSHILLSSSATGTSVPIQLTDIILAAGLPGGVSDASLGGTSLQGTLLAPGTSIDYYEMGINLGPGGLLPGEVRLDAVLYYEESGTLHSFDSLASSEGLARTTSGAPIPEPSTAIMFGFASLLFLARRR